LGGEYIALARFGQIEDIQQGGRELQQQVRDYRMGKLKWKVEA
jgi:hypothetical protein